MSEGHCCGARAALLVQVQELQRELAAERAKVNDVCPTLGEIAEVFTVLKAKGVHRGSALYVIDRVWWEDEQIKEAGR